MTQKTPDGTHPTATIKLTMATDALALHLDYCPVSIDTGYRGLFFDHVEIIVGYEAVFDPKIIPHAFLASALEVYGDSGHLKND